MNEDSALKRTMNQLNVKDGESINEAKRLIFNVLKRRNSLDYLINEALAPNQLVFLDVGVRNFLRLYTYAIHYGGSSFQEANNLIEHTRNMLSSKEIKPIEGAIDIIPHVQLPWKTFTKNKDLAYRYFHPVWYIEYLQRYFDEKKVVKIIESFETPKYIRVNTLKAGENMLNSLTSLGFLFNKVPELKNAYHIIKNPRGLVDTVPYRQGKLLLQDKASILVGEVASPKSTDLVLDICAAPGIKTTHLAQLMDNKGKIISVDYNERRLDSWRMLVKKMGVLNAEPVLADATKPGELPNEMADLVLLDPPCTGTGTFNESPSGKWRINRNSIQQMASIQRRLIANAAGHVVDGGALIYSTCSVTFDENEAVIIDFLKKNPSFRVKKAIPYLGEPGLELSDAQRLYPYLHGCQGFFMVKLEKSK
jgi:16S rRNA (cytosine967-C5)-methyltransferase